MMNLPLMLVNPFMKIAIVIWVIVAVLLILLVLIQKGRGGGLGAAFGGAGGGVLGSKTGDFLTWTTICLVGVWLLLSVVAAKWYKPAQSELLKADTAVVNTMPAVGELAPDQNDSVKTAEAQKTEPNS